MVWACKRMGVSLTYGRHFLIVMSQMVICICIWALLFLKCHHVALLKSFERCCSKQPVTEVLYRAYCHIRGALDSSQNLMTFLAVLLHVLGRVNYSDVVESTKSESESLRKDSSLSPSPESKSLNIRTRVPVLKTWTRVRVHRLSVQIPI